MALFTISKEDLAKGKLVDPGEWYNCEIVNVEDKQTKTSGADITFVTFRILDGAFQDVQLRANFMPEYPGFTIDFLAALKGVERTPEFEQSIINTPIPFDNKTLKGRKIRVHVVRGEYNKKPTKQIEGYQPAA